VGASTLIMRHLKGLEDVVSLSVVLPRRTEEGWVFDNESAKHRDACLGTSALREVYTTADPHVLRAGHRAGAVGQGAADHCQQRIGRDHPHAHSAFAAFTDDEHDYYPSSLRAEIEAVNTRMYKTLNNGVYRSGFARTHDATRRRSSRSSRPSIGSRRGSTGGAI
jgi:putative glutathione S-transferase